MRRERHNARAPVEAPAASFLEAPGAAVLARHHNNVDLSPRRAARPVRRRAARQRGRCQRPPARTKRRCVRAPAGASRPSRPWTPRTELEVRPPPARAQPGEAGWPSSAASPVRNLLADLEGDDPELEGERDAGPDQERHTDRPAREEGRVDRTLDLDPAQPPDHQGRQGFVVGPTPSCRHADGSSRPRGATRPFASPPALTSPAPRRVSAQRRAEPGS